MAADAKKIGVVRCSLTSLPIFALTAQAVRYPQRRRRGFGSGSDRPAGSGRHGRRLLPCPPLASGTPERRMLLPVRRRASSAWAGRPRAVPETFRTGLTEEADVYRPLRPAKRGKRAPFRPGRSSGVRRLSGLRRFPLRRPPSRKGRGAGRRPCASAVRAGTAATHDKCPGILTENMVFEHPRLRNFSCGFKYKRSRQCDIMRLGRISSGPDEALLLKRQRREVPRASREGFGGIPPVGGHGRGGRRPGTGRRSR
jgi:hypothetical protein